MQKLTLAIAIMAAFTINLNAQNCPTASFSLPDSACGGNPINIINTSSGGASPLSYHWDFCPGDLTQNPVYDTIGDFGNLAKATAGIDLVYDNGNWYGFALNVVGHSLTRFDFGNSLLNYPTAVDIVPLAGSAFLDDIQLIKENNEWYAFVCVYQNDIFRIDFGPNITNPSPVVTYVPITPALIGNPFVMKLIKDHDRFKLLVANNSPFSISLVDFGPSITNANPSIANITGNFSATYAITAVRDCDRWYGFLSSPYNADIYVIDFGDTITTTPVSITNLGIQGAVGASREIEVVNDGGKWYAFTLCSGGTLKKINLGNPLNTVSPPVVNTGINIDPNEQYFSIKKSGSTWVGITTYGVNNTEPDLRRFVFPDICDANTPVSSDMNPSGTSYSTAGFHQVTLEVTDANGSTAFYTDSVYSKNSPVTSFVHTNGCAGTPVDFTDSSFISGATITSWNWDFGDLNTSSAQHPVHTYSAPGNYVVTLTTNSSVGCGSSFSDTISVGVLPVAAISFLDNSCAETPVLFTDVSTSQDPIGTWNWNFGDSDSSGQTNPLHSYTAGGTYAVNLTVTTTNGCISSITDSIHIRPRPVPDFSIANTCIGETVTFTNLSSISDGSVMNYDWDLDDNTTSTAENPLHQYPASVGVYDITLIASSPNGCSDTLSSQLRIGTPPNPDFSFFPTTACKGNTVNFSDLSTVSGGGPGDTINTWYWNFGDTYTSSLQHPVHAYADTGSYTVTLVVTTPTSCDSSISKSVYVIDAPSAAFNYTDVCFGNTNTFIDFSSAPAGSVITNRSWDFGDSTSASGTTVSHLYAQPGLYTVILTVTDTFGCTDFSMHVVSVFPVPAASFTNTIACTGTPVYFTNTSTIDNGAVIQSYYWDFGDGSTSTDKDPFHSYSAFGSKTIMMIATSSHGCSDTIYQLLFVNQSPNPGFTYSSTCLGQATQFTYLANPFPSTIASYNWSFGDLGSSNQENPLHTYTSASLYNVTVNVIDNTGCPAGITLPISVNPIPVANFGYSNGCAGIPANFYDSSTVNPGMITGFQWSFGGSNTSVLQSPQFIFDSAGTYPVHLNILSAAGCSDSITKTISIIELPVAGFTMSAVSGSPPFTVSFTNTSTGATAYHWDFGDGNNSTLINPSSIYTDSGEFVIRLIAFNPEGCSDTVFKSVYVLIPHIDLAVINVIPVRQNNLLSLSADLFNLGNITIDNFEIIAEMEGGTIIHEKYSKPMPPGLLTYAFNAKLETNQYTNPSYICVEVINPNGVPDEVPDNNRKCAGNSSTFEVVNIFSDPATEQTTVNFILPAEGNVTIRINDIAGKSVSEEISIKGSKGLNTYNFDTRTLTKGIYSCTVKYREETIVKRISKY